VKKTIENFCVQHHGVDILFNNAGVGEGTVFKNYPLENRDWIINISLKPL
jgi:NADP-dependent 3-hydroxy acid dehydrogenase YdfG